MKIGYNSRMIYYKRISGTKNAHHIVCIYIFLNVVAVADIRVQLSEQTRVLEARAEAAAGVAGELHDYCRRRADLEHEYARALDKLARAAAQRHKDQKHKCVTSRARLPPPATRPATDRLSVAGASSGR